jgi:hypothetical protein
MQKEVSKCLCKKQQRFIAKKILSAKYTPTTKSLKLIKTMKPKL